MSVRRWARRWRLTSRSLFPQHLEEIDFKCVSDGGCFKTSSRPKGDICGNPALQGGGRRPRKSIRLEDGTRLEDATSLDCDSSPSSVFQTGFLIMLASSPALKSGVTIDDAFQAFFLIFHQGRNKTKCFATVPFFCFQNPLFSSVFFHKIALNFIAINAIMQSNNQQ